ncbi:efflux RND transporter permease subunit [Anaerotalea alkaliphila]|uniref:Efflux RND transporter permease subunit n=1 Tax=Anaerotalea alkaliphila TaxID=2662126 RepID=A0A7X5KM66_9FIRM|nr:efflux RND transporter permease subunit [Anaerotalea alkaliphila]NDL66393.1 efflux RND transporter permease subunit [Anaerotalea alkaliphila]
MNLPSLAVRRPITTVMFMLVVVLFGMVSSSRLPIDLYPNIEIPVAIVNTTYANVAPEEIEKLVTRPIEEVMGTVADIDAITSITREGSSIVIAQFKIGTDMDFATLDMREKVDMVAGFLPDGASDPMVMRIDINATPIMQVAVSGADVATLQRYADDVLKPSVERVQGVASAEVSGGYEEYVSIQVDTAKMEGYGLTLDRVAGILGAENINMPAGTVFQGDKELLLRGIGEFEDLEEIRDLPIPLGTGGILRVREIAVVEMANKEQSSITKVDGEPAVSIAVQKQSGTNTVAVANAVRQSLLETAKGSEYEVRVIYDQSDFIKRSINQVANNGMVGGILAVFVLFIFLRSVRSTIIIGLAIPISVIATFILIYFNGITLNMMTLGGLALGIGMLVDNAVVVLENIYRFVQEGKPRKEAAVEGAREVAMAVTASTLTTIAVFLPIVFVEGVTSIMFRELALTVTFSLVSSLVVSLTLVPMLASKLLVVDEQQGMHHANRAKPVAFLLDQADRFYSRLEEGYRNLLRWALHHKKTVVLGAFVFFVASMLSMVLVGKEFMPMTDEGTFTINLETEPGAGVEEIGSLVDQVVEAILDVPELDYVFTNASISSGIRMMNSGAVQGMLVPLDQRNRSVDDVVVDIEGRIARIPGMKATVAATSSTGMMGGGSAISIQIKGDDLELLEDLALQVGDKVGTVQGARNISNSLEDAIPQVEMRLDRNNASRFGLTTAQVASEVKNVLDGKTATRYRIEGDEIDVVLEGDTRYQESITALEQMPIGTPAGGTVPLGLVADIQGRSGPLQINREDQARTVTVSADVYGRDLGLVSAEIQTLVDAMELPRGYTIEFGGQNQEMVEAFSDLGLALILALILVYMIIASQFESLLAPFIIMFTTPLAFSAGTLGLFLTNRNLNVPSIIGYIMLAGIVVNNAIVLIDYIQTRMARGEDTYTAITNAGPIRLRPILMTTLTTVLALFPLALGIGEGAELQAPMSTVVIFGLSISMFLTLVFIPVLFSIMDNRHRKFLAAREARRMKRELKRKGEAL